MKKSRLFSKIAFSAVFASASLFGPSSLLAQVKVGSNPTTINSANNLEVEASTSGRKTSVDKTTGQVTIADGTEGVGKVLTSDANGASSWKAQGGQNGAGFSSFLTATAPFNINAGQGIKYPFPNVTITEAGTYMAIVRTFGSVTNNTQPAVFYTFISKNGSLANEDTFEWYTSVGNNDYFGVSGNLFFTAEVGDVITIAFQNGYAYQSIIEIPLAFLPRNNVRFVKIR